MTLQKYTHLLLTLLILTSCAVKKSTPATASTTETTPASIENPTKHFQAAIDSIYAKHPKSIGLMVHIEAPDQNISWSGAVGLSDKKNKTALQADQPALIASNTKTYTAAAILKLIEKGNLSLNLPVENFLSPQSSSLLSSVGYDLQAITIAHLLSHTSGITDYVDQAYIDAVDKDPMHRWTRAEQIELATKVGGPMGKPGEVFSYADANFLLLTEVIESQTKKQFYASIRELVDYKTLGLNTTWFESLEKAPVNAKPLVYQYWTDLGWNSYKMDKSFDLYGAGGIAATTKDLARFSQTLFENKIITNPEVLNLIYTKIETKDKIDNHYFMGLQESKINKFQAYGHGGFWGTVVQYFPELNASISVYVLDRDKRALRIDILEKLVSIVATGK